MVRATYGSHSDEEHQAFVRPPHARATTTSRRVMLGTSFALLGAAAATAAYVAFVEPPKPMTISTTKLEAATLAESLAAELSLDESTDTTFEALDMDGNGVVTKSEYLSRLQARRDDVLAKLEQSNLTDDAKEPISTMIRDNFDNEVACVTNVFDMSGDRVVDKTTFEFVHPLIASLCKKTPGNGGIAGATSESVPTAPPQVDIDGNVVPAPGESGVSIDGGPSVPNQSIDGNVPVPVETPASNFNDDILVPTPAVPENDESSAAGEAETPSADQGGPNPSDNGEGPTTGGEEDTGDDSATPGADTSETEAPGTDEDVNDTDTDENDTGDDAAPATDNAPVNNSDENGGDEVTPTTPTETPASEENGNNEASAADETAPADENGPGPSADETGDNAGPSGTDENNEDQEATTSPGSEDVSGNGEDETTAAPGGDVDTEEATTEPTSADDQSTTAPGEDVGANGDEDSANAPEEDVDDNEELTIAPNDQTTTAPGEDTGATDEGETTNAPGNNEETTTPTSAEDQATTAPDEDAAANGSNEEDQESTTTPTSAAPSLAGANNATENATETPQTESAGANTNSPVSSMLSEIQNAVSDVSLPGDGTVNATTGSISHQDPAVIKTFIDDLNPSENSSDPSAPEQKSPERVAFESELSEDLADEFSDRTQRLAFANMEVKKNAFVINLIEECITHAGRRFEFDASFTRDMAAEWIKTKCLVFPDLFQHKENP